MNNWTDDQETKLLDSEKYQLQMASRVSREDTSIFEKEVVTGVDVSYRKQKAYGCAVVYHIPTRRITQVEQIVTDCEESYISGHFYLREGPVIIALLERIEKTGPILIDGNGILHPRRMGLASYVGVELNKQTIGVAKSLLMGRIDKKKGNIASIVDKGEEIGAALWIGNRKKPVYVSIGHRISLETAVEVTLFASISVYPEPLRQAHICSKKMSKDV